MLKVLFKVFLAGSRMATCHGVQKDGMVLILPVELPLSGDSVNPHREREAFIFT
jgi:hypothetical protein